MILFLVLVVVGILAGAVAWKLLSRRPEVLVVSGRRELLDKAPAQTPQSGIPAMRTDTVMFRAVNPEDYPWARV